MRFNELLHSTPKPDRFIYDYLEVLGVENPYSYYHIDDSTEYQFDYYYTNIDKAVQLMDNQYDCALILVDCDVDGLCSAAIIGNFLTQQGWDCKYYFHKTKAHGLSDNEVAAEINSNTPTESLLIIPDASGTPEQCASMLVKDILILDHHDITDNNPYAVIINNQLPSNHPDINKALSGAGVTWHFVRALSKHWGVTLEYYLDIVALSILSDVRDLRTMENRQIVNTGMSYISNNFLIDLIVEFINKNLYDEDDYSSFTPEDVVWKTIPKINASVRSGDVGLQENILRGLLGDNTVEESLDTIATMKKAYNHQYTFVAQKTESLLSQIDSNSKCNFIKGEDLGNYAGLIANKIMSVNNKPTVVFHESGDKYIGSVRSPIPTKDVFDSSRLFEWNAGHDSAYGTCFDKNNLDAIQKWSEGLNLNIEPTYNVCRVFDDTDLIPYYLFTVGKTYDYLWGEGVYYPLFGITNVDIYNTDIQVIGKNKTTIKFESEGLTYIKFFCNDRIKNKLFIGASRRKMRLTILGKLNINIWNGNETQQVIIEDFDTKLPQHSWKDVF